MPCLSKGLRERCGDGTENKPLSVLVVLSRLGTTLAVRGRVFMHQAHAVQPPHVAPAPHAALAGAHAAPIQPMYVAAVPHAASAQNDALGAEESPGLPSPWALMT